MNLLRSGDDYVRKHVKTLAKWVQFDGETIGRHTAEHHMKRSLRRLCVPQLDLMQIHWGDALHTG